MPEEKRPDVIRYENIPKSGLGLLGYMGFRIKRDASQLAGNLKNVFNPVFTQDTDEEALLEDDELSESEYYETSSTLAESSNNLFNAEDEEVLKKAQMNVENFTELLKQEAVNAPITQKTPASHATPIQPDHFSATIGIRLIRLYLDDVSGLMSEKIQSLIKEGKEGNESAKTKAGLLANIIKPVSMLRATNIEHEYYHEDALIQAIADIRKSISDNQAELSRYRSKWGSGFFFGKLLRMDLTKRVTSRTLIDDLSIKLDDIEKSAWGKIR